MRNKILRMNSQNLTLTDGRNFEYITNDLHSESAVILHAGTMQDIEGWPTWLAKFAENGVRAIAIGRSGYAGSTAKPGRVTVDIAHDVAQLATALGITRFVSIGLSGGGQHAIATGIDARSVGVVTVGSLAPFADLGADFYKGMQQIDIDEYADALNDIATLIRRFQGYQEGNAADIIGGNTDSERDRIAQQSQSWSNHMTSCDFTMSQGWDWVADDYSSYLKPWGFDPRDIQVPVVVWQAGEDKNVPVVHGEWLCQHLPKATLEFRADESHLGLFVNYEDEIIESALKLLQS